MRRLPAHRHPRHFQRVAPESGCGRVGTGNGPGSLRFSRSQSLWEARQATAAAKALRRNRSAGQLRERVDRGNRRERLLSCSMTCSVCPRGRPARPWIALAARQTDRSRLPSAASTRWRSGMVRPRSAKLPRWAAGGPARSAPFASRHARESKFFDWSTIAAARSAKRPDRAWGASVCQRRSVSGSVCSAASRTQFRGDTRDSTSNGSRRESSSQGVERIITMASQSEAAAICRRQCSASILTR